MIYKCFATPKLLGGIKVGWVIKQTIYTFKKSLNFLGTRKRRGVTLVTKSFLPPVLMKWGKEDI